MSEAPAEGDERSSRGHRREAGALLLAVFVAAISGIVNELLLGTAASYLLGDTIREWSLTIGTFLAAMGLGSFSSRFVAQKLLPGLVATEIAAAILGGFGPLVFFGAYAWSEDVAVPAFYLVVGGVGFVVGLEVPLLTRALHRYGGLRETLSSVFGLDYGGALVASIAYPFVLYPELGVVRTAMVAALFNLSGAVLILYAFHRREGRVPRAASGSVVLALGVVVGGLGVSGWLSQKIDEQLFAPETLVYAEVSPYQQLALTRGRGDETRLYLNGHLQFASHDEARYHESLVHVPIALRAARAEEGVDSISGARVLVLGGGDGLALRELLGYEIAHVTLVDLDPSVTDLARRHPLMRELNQGSFDDPRVELIHDDALQWLRRAAPESYDLVFVDLPDPSSPALARLYSLQFDRLVARVLRPGAVGVVQAGSPWFAREAFWSIETTLRAAELRTLAYHVHIPSFGEWGFVAFARGAPLEAPARLVSRRPHRFLRDDVLPGLFVFPGDVDRIDVPPHTVMAPQLPERFLRGWQSRGG